MLQMLSLPVRVNGINALWLLAIGLSALPIALFNIVWHRHSQVKANGLLVNLLLAFGNLCRGGNQLRHAGGDGGDDGPVRGISDRLRAIRKAVVCVGTSGNAADGVELLVGVVVLRHPRPGAD